MIRLEITDIDVTPVVGKSTTAENNILARSLTSPFPPNSR